MVRVRWSENVCDRLLGARSASCSMWSARSTGPNGRGRRSAPPRRPQQTPGKAGGAASLMHRAAVEPRGVGGTKGGPQHAAAVLRRCCGGSASGERGGCSGCTATPAGCSECRACPTPHPKCCPISRSEVDSLHPDRPTAAERATVVRPSPGRRSFRFCGRWLADYCSRSSP